MAGREIAGATFWRSRPMKLSTRSLHDFFCTDIICIHRLLSAELIKTPAELRSKNEQNQRPAISKRPEDFALNCDRYNSEMMLNIILFHCHLSSVVVTTDVSCCQWSYVVNDVKVTPSLWMTSLTKHPVSNCNYYRWLQVFCSLLLAGLQLHVHNRKSIHTRPTPCPEKWNK